MTTSSVPVSLTEPLAAPQGTQDTTTTTTADALKELQARMEGAFGSLAVKLTEGQVEEMCTEYGRVMADVIKGRAALKTLTRWRSMAAKWAGQGRGGAKVKEENDAMEAVRAALDGRLGAGNPNDMFRRAVELTPGPLSGPRGWE